MHQLFFLIITSFILKPQLVCFGGYALGIKEYKLYDIVTKSFFHSRDVIFHENLFPFHFIAHSNDLIDSQIQISQNPSLIYLTYQNLLFMILCHQFLLYLVSIFLIIFLINLSYNLPLQSEEPPVLLNHLPT